MNAFDFVMLLCSFVYAAAVVHFLATVGDLIIASRRVQFSWLNAGWMAASLLSVLAWWIGSWDLRTLRAWDVPSIFANFGAAGLLYLSIRLVCPRVPLEGDIDLNRFHLEEGRKYLAVYAVVCAMTVAYNFAYGTAANLGVFLKQNLVVGPMCIAAIAALLCIGRRSLQITALLCVLILWACYFSLYQSPLA